MGWLSDSAAGRKYDARPDGLHSFEERAVKRILTYSDRMPPNLGIARNECKQLTGQTFLNFRWFNASYKFPVRLGSAQLPNLHKLLVGDLFGHFTTLPQFKAFERLCEDLNADPAQDRVGLVFNWGGIGVGTVILHNYPVRLSERANLHFERGTRIVRTLGRPPITYVMEDLQDFVAFIGSDWAHA